jgi:hypothetical protein
LGGKCILLVILVVHLNLPTVPTKRDLLCGGQSIIWNIDDGLGTRSRGHVGVVGAASIGIELVLSKNSLPVAQIRIRCKNVPQVGMSND